MLNSGEQSRQTDGGQVVVGALVIRAPFKIEMRGFQGFHYTPTLF